MKNVAELRHPYIRALTSPEVLRLVKFGLVGLTGVAVNTGVVALFKEAWGLLFVGAVAGHVLSVLNNFTWNELWTFRERRRNTAFRAVFGRWFRFQLSMIVGALVYLGVLALTTKVFGIHYLVGNLIAIVIGSIFNYLASVIWVWRVAPQARASDGPNKES